MKKTLRKYGLLFLVTAVLLFTAVGCDLGGLGGGNDKESVIIKIADIVFDENGATVKYEDGYEIFLSEESLLQNPFAYGMFTSGSLTLGEIGKVESMTAESVTKEQDEDSLGDYVDDEKDEKNEENVYNGAVEYTTIFAGNGSYEFSTFYAADGSYEFGTFVGGSGNLIYGTIVNAVMGVRIMGAGKTTVIGSMAHMGSSGSLGFISSSSSSVSITASNSFMEIDGKQYECYDSDPRFAEYFATRLIEVTVSAEIPGVEGETVEIKAILAYGFENMTALTTVHIPVSITNIGDTAFAGCTSLTDLFFDGTVEQWNKIVKGKSWDENTGEYTVHCTDGDIAKGAENTDTEKGDDFVEPLPDDKNADAEVEEVS